MATYFFFIRVCHPRCETAQEHAPADARMHTETHTQTNTHTHPARTPMPLLCGLPQPPAVLSAAARCQQSGVWVKIRLVEGLGKIRASMTVHCQVDVVINLPVHHSLLPLSLGLRHLYWPLFRRHRTPRYKLFCERFHHHSPFFRASTRLSNK